MASKNCLNNTADYFFEKLDAVMKVFDLNIDQMGLICVDDTKVDSRINAFME